MMSHQVYEDKYYRAAPIGEVIIVKQNARVEKWDKATIRCSSTPAMTPKEARELAKQIVEATKLAELWNKERADKPIVAADPGL